MTTDNVNDEELPPEHECDWCGYSSTDEDNFSTVEGELVCDDCMSYAETCNDCGSVQRTQSEMYYAMGEYVCQSCYENNYGSCEYCEEVYAYDIGPECGCENEYCNSRLVHDYSYRPNAIFHRTPECSRGRSTLYLGCELEMENNGCDSLTYGAELAHSKSNNEDLFYLKHDGSVSRGFELVTHPMTLAYIRDTFKWTVADTMSNIGYRAWDTDDSCGFHIHLSRSAFVSRSHVFKFVWFVYANSEPLISFAGRHSTSYARFEPSELQTLTYKARGGGQDTRYYALNTQNSRTIELRFMRGSLNRETLIAYCEFADAVFHYTKTLSINDIAERNGISFGSFSDWVSKQDYPALSARIARRCRTLSEI